MSIGDCVCAGGVVLGQTAGTWEEAVTLAGDRLVRAGVCDSSYVRDMVGTVRELGPYIVITPGVALAHARPRGNVLRNGIAIATFPEGVVFGNPDNDPVYVVFAIAATTDEEHLGLFQRVALFLGEEGAIDRLASARRLEDLPNELREELVDHEVA
ncbi:PTS sugar transporter subunit IIA [Thermophilibacter sp.]